MIKVGDCPIHGLVPVHNFYVTGRPELGTGDCCAACYFEWIKENVQKVNNPRVVEVQTP
jgi:hypothetical protein